MRQQNRRRLLSLLVVPTVVGLLLSVTPEAVRAQSSRPAPIRVTVESPLDDGSTVVPVDTPLLTVTYEVHVYGGTAVGTLVEEFRNASEETTRGRLRHACPANVEMTSLRLRPGLEELEIVEETEGDEDESQGEITRLAEHIRGGSPELSESQAIERARRIVEHARQKREGSRPGDEPMRQVLSDWFEMEPGESTVLETGFRTPLTVDGHRMRLVLPALTVSPSAGAEPQDGPAPLTISITVHHDAPLIDVTSTSHPILSDFEGDRTVIEPVATTVASDRPFELEFALQSDDRPNLVSRVLGIEDDLQEVETLLNPPRIVPETEVRPKQVLFLVDTSGSMAQSRKLEQAKRAVEACVDALRPEDRFNVVEFDSEFNWFRPEPVDARADRKGSFGAWLTGLKAEGGTTVLPALESAMARPDDAERLRILILVTDGILADEKAALELLDESLGSSRLFVVGTGPQLRQETLLRLAEHGRGAATFATEPDQLEAAVADLFDSVADPLGWDVEFDWSGAEVEEITPSRLPDLYAGRAVRVLARVRGDLPETLRVRMTTTEGDEWLSVRLPPLDP